jgi:hypothetical protein
MKKLWYSNSDYDLISDEEYAKLLSKKTIAGTLISLMEAAATKEERDMVLDRAFNVKVAKQGTPAHGYLLFKDGSGLECTESPDESDDIVFWKEVEWTDRSAN